MITASFGGFEVNNHMLLFSAWPSGLGEMKDGSFDVDVWEAGTEHFFAVPGADIRAAWKDAYRLLRKEAQTMGGLKWLDTNIDEEPCPLPDRKPYDLKSREA